MKSVREPDCLGPPTVSVDGSPLVSAIPATQSLPSPVFWVFSSFSSHYPLIPSVYFCFKPFGLAPAHGSTSWTACPAPEQLRLAAPGQEGTSVRWHTRKEVWVHALPHPLVGWEEERKSGGACGHELSCWIRVVSHISVLHFYFRKHRWKEMNLA